MITKQRSLKFKLLLYYLLVQAILFVIFSSIMVKMLKDSVEDKVETNLKVIILDIKDDIIEHHKGIDTLSLEKELDEFQIKPLYINIIQNGKVIKTNDFPNDIPANTNIQYDKIYFDVINQKMVSSLKFSFKGSDYIIQLSTSPKHLPELFPNLKYIFIFIAPIILLFSIIFGNMLIAKTFKPIEKLLQEIQNIGAKSLSSRVSLNNSNDEIDQISYEVNKLLGRVEKAYTQISQFTSDASHELKTPLTILRGEIELALKEDREKDEYKATLKSAQDEILNIQKTIESLLLLAKVESKELNLDDIIYLDEMLIELTKELKPIFTNKNCELELDIKEPLSIKGNEELFKIVLKNIIENGVFYSKQDSKMKVTLLKEKDKGLIVIEDFGIGMSKQTVENIFEKFYRGDTSRSKNTGGTGLGMSIVQKISQLHNVDINIKSEIDKGTKITLSFEYLEF